MPHLGDKLKEFRKKKNMNQPEMADFVGIGKRTYQTIELTGTVKKIEDIIKIKVKTGIDAQKFTHPEDGGEANPAIHRDLPYKGGITLNDHIEEIKTNREYIKETNEYLKGLVAFSLNDLSKTQKEMHAHLIAAIRRQAERFAEEDPERTKQELDKISIYAFDSLGINFRKDIQPDAGKVD